VSIAIRVFPDTYIDSVVQLRGMRAMREIGDVEWASAGMATPANIETLRAEGVDPADVEGIGSNDFFIVARGIDGEAASRLSPSAKPQYCTPIPLPKASSRPRFTRCGRRCVCNRSPTSQWSRCRVTTLR
jgi:hypothetical protein